MNKTTQKEYTVEDMPTFDLGEFVQKIIKDVQGENYKSAIITASIILGVVIVIFVLFGNVVGSGGAPVISQNMTDSPGALQAGGDITVEGSLHVTTPTPPKPKLAYSTTTPSEEGDDGLLHTIFEVVILHPAEKTGILMWSTQFEDCKQIGETASSALLIQEGLGVGIGNKSNLILSMTCTSKKPLEDDGELFWYEPQ